MRLLVVLVLVACADDRATGTLGGECLPGNACAAGLLCVEDSCQRPSSSVPDAVPGPDATSALDAAQGSPDSGPVGEPPVAEITHPGTETRPAGSSVPFIGNANDPEDGALTGGSLVWVSNLAGEIGRGETFSVTLSAGTHTVTLTATDSDGNTGTDQITFTME